MEPPQARLQRTQQTHPAPPNFPRPLSAGYARTAVNRRGTPRAWEVKGTTPALMYLRVGTLVVLPAQRRSLVLGKTSRVAREIPGVNISVAQQVSGDKHKKVCYNRYVMK